MKKVSKAVILAAGRGTRFLPYTKACPKEMLPVVDTPSLQLILQEANFIKQSMQLVPGSVQADEIPLETVKFAMCVVAAGPMVAIFPFFQRYFSKGVMVGAGKG